MLYVIHREYQLTEKILHGIRDRKNVLFIKLEEIEVNFVIDILSRAECLFFTSFFLNKKYTPQFISQLQEITHEDKVLLWDIVDIRSCTFIKRTIKTVNISIWIWNPIKSISHNTIFQSSLLFFLKRNSKNICTFDPDDAKHHNLMLKSQVYFYDDSQDLNTTMHHNKYDVVFIGADKGRINELIKIYELLHNLGISTYFHIFSDIDRHYSNEELKYIAKDHISYSQVIEIIKNAACILEITQEGQSGATIRVMESIFHKKKLISNNLHLLDMDTYLTKNIFFLGHDDEKQLLNFINSEFTPIEKECYEKHDINNWIQCFY